MNRKALRSRRWMRDMDRLLLISTIGLQPDCLQNGVIPRQIYRSDVLVWPRIGALQGNRQATHRALLRSTATSFFPWGSGNSNITLALAIPASFSRMKSGAISACLAVWRDDNLMSCLIMRICLINTINRPRRNLRPSDPHMTKASHQSRYFLAPTVTGSSTHWTSYGSAMSYLHWLYLMESASHLLSLSRFLSLHMSQGKDDVRSAGDYSNIWSCILNQVLFSYWLLWGGDYTDIRGRRRRLGWTTVSSIMLVSAPVSRQVLNGAQNDDAVRKQIYIGVCEPRYRTDAILKARLCRGGDSVGGRYGSFLQPRTVKSVYTAWSNSFP